MSSIVSSFWKPLASPLSQVLDLGKKKGVARGCGWQHMLNVNLGAFYLVGIPIAATLAFWVQLRGKGLWIGIQAGALVQSIMLSTITSFTNWEKQILDSYIFAFWAKASIDIEPRRIRLKSNRYTTNHILDTVTAATFQLHLSVPYVLSSLIGNEGREYVLRRILRRDVRYGTEVLEAQPGFFSGLVKVLVQVMGDVFPELRQHEVHIRDTIAAEEASFGKTLLN